MPPADVESSDIAANRDKERSKTIIRKQETDRSLHQSSDQPYNVRSDQSENFSKEGSMSNNAS